MKKKKLLLIALFLVWVAPSFAAKVDTLLIKSPSMNKDVQVVVVTPDAALGKKAVVCPAIYLLHGYGGNAKTWIGIKPNLPQIADEKGIIFVCPDGKNSWYWDSPVNPSFRYETFISSELVKYIDEHYKTIADRKGRAITGLSMGGHGAMWNAIRHKDTFGASGSTSGGMDIRPFPKNWSMGEMRWRSTTWVLVMLTTAGAVAWTARTTGVMRGLESGTGAAAGAVAVQSRARQAMVPAARRSPGNRENDGCMVNSVIVADGKRTGRPRGRGAAAVDGRRRCPAFVWAGRGPRGHSRQDPPFLIQSVTQVKTRHACAGPGKTLHRKHETSSRIS